jgi:heme exporter protein A
VLEVRSLHLWRGDTHVLRGLGFSVAAGEALQLLWPNGAGKTSLLRVLAGLLPAESGQVLWRGGDTDDNARDFHRDLSYLGHDLALKGDLSVLQNLEFALALRSRPARRRLLSTLEAVGLRAPPDELVRRLSAGQQRRVALARLLLWDATLWLLDEPVANLDGAGQDAFRDAISAHLANGGLAVISTHQALDLPRHATRLWRLPAEAA